MNGGTPKTLKEAIRNGASVAKGLEFDETIKKHVRDFMAQKFSVAMLKSETIKNKLEVEELLEELWTNLTGEGK